MVIRCEGCQMPVQTCICSYPNGTVGVWGMGELLPSLRQKIQGLKSPNDDYPQHKHCPYCFIEIGVRIAYKTYPTAPFIACQKCNEEPPTQMQLINLIFSLVTREDID